MLTFAVAIATLNSPQFYVWALLFYTVILTVLIILPFARPGLGSRILSFAAALFVGIATASASDEQASAAERHVAALATIADAPPALQAEANAAKAEHLPRQAQAQRQTVFEPARQSNKEADVASHIEQLDREIASMQSVRPSQYARDVAAIDTGLLLLGAWARLYAEGEPLDLQDEALQKRRQFRNLLVTKQRSLLPIMRNAYGPAMRQQLRHADISVRTLGAGYRTVEFVSAAFEMDADIKQMHQDVEENLTMLRFTRVQYKPISQAPDFSYHILEVPKDSELVQWQSGGAYRILD